MRIHVLAVTVSLTRIVSVDAICFGGTMYGNTWWEQYTNRGIFTNVDASACKFKKKPVFVTGLSGWSSHWTSLGGSSVYSDTNVGYRDYVMQKDITVANARNWGWTNNFLAQEPGKSRSGVCAGTTEGNTKWKKYKRFCLYTDVDTSNCGFAKTPVYKTSLGGKSGNWEAMGASSLYKATEKGFRVYVCGFFGLTLRKAKQWSWHIKWIAHPVGSVTHAAGVAAGSKTCAGMTPPKKTAWKEYKHAKGKGIYVDVKTGCKFWGATPRYVVEVGGTSSHGNAYGTSEVYFPTATGFRMYLYYDAGITPSKANKWAWNVQWIAAAPVPSLCFGGTTPGRTAWKNYHSHPMVTVSTKACAEIDRPVYVTNLNGFSSHWTTTGGNAIYSDTATSFTSYVHQKGGWNIANRAGYKWHINFLAFPAGKSKSGICAGETTPGNTAWKQHTSNGVYVDVDTSWCGFKEPPVYKTSIGGAAHHWSSKGSNSFVLGKFVRVYVYSSGITGKKANDMKWHIKWVAHPKGEVVDGGRKSCAGKSSPQDWKRYASYGMYIDVKTGCKFAEGTPKYVTSLAGLNQWRATGMSEVYSPSADGFRLYLNFWKAIKPADAARWRYEINWIAAGSVPPTPVPTPAPNMKRLIKGGGWAVTKGKCRIDARVPGRPCLVSPNFPGKYSAEETCVVNLGKKTTHVAFDRFNTEKWFDFVEIGKTQYSGAVKLKTIAASPPIITWSSDFFEQGKGWTICKAKAPKFKLLGKKKHGKKNNKKR